MPIRAAPALPSGWSRGVAVEEIAARARRRAEELYEEQGYCCSEALLVAVNELLGGGLAPEVARRLGSGFCHGLGGAGCLCGALSGAVAMVGLFLGPGQPGGLGEKALAAEVNRLHGQFVARFGSPCCRVLTEEAGGDRQRQRQYCRELSGESVALTVRLLLAARPELAAAVPA